MKSKWIALCLVCFMLPCATDAFAADKGVYIAKWIDQGDDWYKSDEGKKIIANILAWQNPNGGWFKSYDTMSARPAEIKPTDHGLAPKTDSGEVWAAVSTIDNDATYTELRILARAVRVTGNEAAKASFMKGLQFLFDSQYPNGGWPQRFPLQKNYGRYITFNDGAMVGVVMLMRDVAQSHPDFAFVEEATRTKCQESFDRQQHHEVTFEPMGARSFELPSLCTSESAGITLLLMEIKQPEERVKTAVEASEKWFAANAIHGKGYPKLTGPQYENGYDRLPMDDPSAPPLWARFYSMETGKPMFVDRDGSQHDVVTELGYERRTGYA